VVREDVHFGEGGLEIDYAEHLFSFWEHPFYRAGGVGDIPANWHWFWGLRK
jgi:hypothetical protein